MDYSKVSTKRKLLRFFKGIPGVNLIRRLYNASQYYNKKYWQILKWGFTSNEDTNYTYDLTAENILYLAQTIAVVTNINEKIVLGYIEEIRQDEELKKHIVGQILKSKFRKYADVDVQFGRRLGWYAFVRILKPKIIIETGVDKGLGSVLLCAALLRNKEEGNDGYYYGTDINIEAGYLLSGKYASVGKILYGDSIKSLESFDRQIDLFINDSDHSADYEYNEYLSISSKLTDNGLILGDNCDITSKLSEYSLQTGRKFIYFKECPLNHWTIGAGIGISFKPVKGQISV